MLLQEAIHVLNLLSGTRGDAFLARAVNRLGDDDEGEFVKITFGPIKLI